MCSSAGFQLKFMTKTKIGTKIIWLEFLYYNCVFFTFHISILRTNFIISFALPIQLNILCFFLHLVENQIIFFLPL